MIEIGNFQKIVVLGAGRWGTAMAIFLSRRDLEVTLVCRSEKTYRHLLKHDKSPRLPAFSCEGRIHFETAAAAAMRDADLAVVSVPVPFLRDTLESLGTISEKTVLVGINKGIERGTLMIVPEIVGEIYPNNVYAHLGGPCFPEGLLFESTPTAETLACSDIGTGEKLQKLFTTPGFRVYLSRDLYGVALLGAVKNVFAIAAGMADGMGLHEEATSVLLSRGLAEMKRLCEKLDISANTLYGLSGLGDLALTCYSPSSSHNKNFGREIGKGKPVEAILEAMEGSIAEGYFTSEALEQLGTKHDLELPLINMIYRILYEDLPLREGLSGLMNRPLKMED